MKLLSRKMESSGAAHGSDEHVHVMPLSMYFGVFAALLVLTVVTVGVSLLGLPPMLAIVVAMAVATVKAVLVVLYFMHLRYENPFYAFIFVSSLFFVALFFVFTLGDLAFRGFVIPEQATEVWRDEQIAIKQEQANKLKNTQGAPASAPLPVPGAKGNSGSSDSVQPAPAP